MPKKKVESLSVAKNPEEKLIEDAIDEEEVEEIVKQGEKINKLLDESDSVKDIMEGINEGMGDDSSTQEEAIAKITTKLTKDDPRTIKLLSELSSHEITLVAIEKAKAREFDNSLLDDLLDDLLRLKISRKREGRKEIIKVAGAAREQELRKSILSRIGLSRLRQQ